MSATPQPATGPVSSERDVRKVARVSLVGASVEWFDFFLFGTAAALVFPTVFFNGQDKGGTGSVTAILISFGVFGIGFLARPLGGILWGNYGDKVGRKQAFIAALLLMAVSTFLIGILPGYDTRVPGYGRLEILAPILLTLLRFFQGLAVGGQWGGAALLATESAPPNKRGFYGSFAQLGVPIGVLLGVTAYFILFELMGQQAFLAWGWRIPFVLSVVFVGFVIYTKKRLEETPEFKRLQAGAAARAVAKAASGATEPTKAPVTEVLTKHWRTVLLAGGAYIVTNAVFYLYIVFMLDYGVRVLGLETSDMLLPVSIANLVMIAIVPLTAAWSDRIGRAPLYIAGAIGTAIWAFPFFALVNTKNMGAMILAFIVGIGMLGMMYGLMAAYFAELFPPEVRYSGASLGYQLGAVLGGALFPIAAVQLLKSTGSTTAISLVMIALSVLAVVCIMILSRNTRRSAAPSTPSAPPTAASAAT